MERRLQVRDPSRTQDELFDELRSGLQQRGWPDGDEMEAMPGYTGKHWDSGYRPDEWFVAVDADDHSDDVFVSVTHLPWDESEYCWNE